MTVDPSRLRTCIKKIQEDPYDLEAWQLVIKDGQARPISESRDTFERLVSYFPTSGKFWKIYIEQEIRARNYEKVEKLFTRCLIKVLNIDLWKTYLSYVKDTKAALPTYKEKMAQAYDFALEKMGMDIASFPIWNDYVRFLKAVDAVGSYAENQKITAIRKVFQKGIVNPMAHIEQLWKDYIAFEQSINPLIAEKMTSERSRDYMNARRVAKEYEACTRGLNKFMPCVPPTGNPEESKQVELWQKYISWERKNPLHVEDPAVITKRVMFAYEQCLLCLGHHPNIWYEAAVFLQENAKILKEKGDVDTSRQTLEMASALLERAINGMLKKSLLLHFAYADLEEQHNRIDKAKGIYNKFLEIEDVDPTLCYIQLMKFSRRSEGTTAARAVFKRAREDMRCSHQVFVAAALMEYYCTKEKKIASNVFELGFKRYKNDEDYILAYIDYLSHLNEDNNTRVLFERALTSGSLPADQQIEIWNKFLEFEANIGDMASLIKVEKRRAAALEKELEISDTSQLIDRYKFGDLYPCTNDELRILGYTKVESTRTILKSRLAAAAAVPIQPPSESNGATSTPGEAQKAQPEEEKSLPRPDVSQMIPFKPQVNWRPIDRGVPGGVFPYPAAVDELLRRLPPPQCFEGPHVIIDRLIDVFMKSNIPEMDLLAGGPVTSNGQSGRLFDTARSAAASLSQQVAAVTSTIAELKRKKRSGSLEADSPNGKRARSRGKSSSRGPGDSDDEDSANTNIVRNTAPINDLYRMRQQRRLR